MIYPKGSIVKYEPTRRGRERAVALIAEFPHAAQTVPRLPHHVELMEDFAFAPVAPAKPARKSAPHSSFLSPE